MDLHIYDTKQRRKRLFEPQSRDNVLVYVCGPTVYDRIHIGNGLSAVVFDVLIRFLRSVYPKVTYVRNITDIDDKINNRALELGIPIEELTADCTQALHQDYEALGVLPPDVEPKATHHIVEIIAMIEDLISRQHAYFADGHVLFYVPSDPNYGSLTNKTLEQLIDGARIEVAPYKKDPKDFVLWKPSTDDLPGWDSPWGRGRPGWHIECSAMIRKHLGPTIDIHGGGVDLAFPHHENEHAQSGCLEQNTDYVRYWMHNGMLNLGSQKMSKSVGNIQSVHELLQSHSGETLRYAVLSGHYRQSLRWDDNLIQQSNRSLDSLYQALRHAEQLCGEFEIHDKSSPVSAEQLPSEVLEPLADDLNTPRALAGLHKLASTINQTDSQERIEALRDQLLSGAWVMGLLTKSVSDYFTTGATLSDEEIKMLIEERAVAKQAKEFDQADAIRAKLASHGVVIEDSREGTRWRVASDS